MTIAQNIPEHIRRVSKSLGFALWLDGADEWFGLSVILQARLAPRQRAALAYAALRSLDHDHASMTAQAFFGGGAGQPIAPLFNSMDEAVFWADMAAPAELDAYALASFNRMAKARQAAFLDYVGGNRRAAA